MNVLQRILAGPSSEQERGLWPLDFANIGGRLYPLGLNQTLVGTKEEIGSGFDGLATGAYQASSVVYACMAARLALFTEARFVYRQLRSGRPGEFFSKPTLEILHNPWPGGTTGDLLARMIQDSDLAGNSFILRRNNRLTRLRPDWVTILYGSRRADASMWDVDAELVGYAYQPGGPGGGRESVLFQPEEVAHFAPTPDPLAPHRGISWLGSLLREIEADNAATSVKLAFFANGATVNLVVTGITAQSQQAFDDWVKAFESKHKGIAQAYKTLYLTGGADVKAVGADLQQSDFKAVQGAGETRIAAAAGVPPIVAGLSEGLQGSSLNAGNFESAMRRFADITIRPLWRNACGSLSAIVPVPSDAELWYMDADIPALKSDISAAAEVMTKNATAIRTLVDGGFDPDTAVEAVNAGDLKRLVHTGKTSVQLQPPAEEPVEEEEPEEEEPAEETSSGRDLAHNLSSFLAPSGNPQEAARPDARAFARELARWLMSDGRALRS